MHKISTAFQFSKRRLTMAREPETHWVPNADVYIAETGIVIKVELAGMQRENLELMIEGNSLKISGQRDDGCREALELSCELIQLRTLLLQGGAGRRVRLLAERISAAGVILIWLTL